MLVSLVTTPNDYSKKLKDKIENTLKEIDCLPKEIFLCIFKILPLPDLGRICRVNKNWHILSIDKFLWKTINFKKFFPSTNFLYQEVWKDHASFLDLSVDDVELDERSFTKFLASLPNSELVEEESGWTVLTIPKGLTLNKLLDFIKLHKQENIVILEDLLKNHPDFENPVKKTYKAAISNRILKNSRNITIDQQKELLNQIGCQVSDVLSIFTFAILTYMNSKKWPSTHQFNNKPKTYMRCSDQFDQWHIVAGNLNSSHFCISYDGILKDENLGVTAIRKFSEI